MAISAEHKTFISLIAIDCCTYFCPCACAFSRTSRRNPECSYSRAYSNTAGPLWARLEPMAVSSHWLCWYIYVQYKKTRLWPLKGRKLRYARLLR